MSKRLRYVHTTNLSTFCSMIPPLVLASAIPLRVQEHWTHALLRYSVCRPAENGYQFWLSMLYKSSAIVVVGALSAVLEVIIGRCHEEKFRSARAIVRSPKIETVRARLSKCLLAGRRSSTRFNPLYQLAGSKHQNSLWLLRSKSFVLLKKGFWSKFV